MELHAQIACGLPFELMKRGVPWQERAVYVEAVLFCRERLTDGIIHRALLPMWMPDMSPKARAARLDALVNTGALLEHEDGWQFPPHVWSRWNPSKAEVDEKRRQEAERKAEYRERRRMSQRDIDGTSADVRPCPTPVPDSQSQSQSKSHSQSHSSSARSLRAADLDGVVRNLFQRMEDTA